jgi:hypothetical protein
MKGILLLAAAFVVGTAGYLIGAIFAPPAQASTTYTVEIMGSTTTYLNCGWHAACVTPTPTPGVALDWDERGDLNVYFRSFGYIGNTTGAVARATISRLDDGTNCKYVYADLSSPSGVTYRGSAMYGHTETSWQGTFFSVWGSPTWSWTQVQVGDTAEDENDNCAWGGLHVHQRAYWYNVSSSSINIAVYPPAINAGGGYSIDTRGNHQDKASWVF